MVGRPRCANCKKAFTPHARNRGKLVHVQRVCRGCGPVIGHRIASRRYRARRSGRTSASMAPVPSVLNSDPVVSPLAGEFVRQIQRGCSGLAALGFITDPRDGFGVSNPHPVGNDSSTSPQSRVMASRPSGRYSSGSA